MINVETSSNQVVFLYELFAHLYRNPQIFYLTSAEAGSQSSLNQGMPFWA